jgi:arylformamidase
MADRQTSDANDSKQIAAKLKPLGIALTPEMISGTLSVFASLQTGPVPKDVTVTRDARYGSADRNRLDIFTPNRAGRGSLPVLMFVHGGGFIQGDKSTTGSPFYDNIGLWAAKNGFVGVTMTYRLAPQHRWPSGSDDVSAAVKWLRENIAAHGGDAARIFVMGQSAGAVHVAGYIAREHSAGSAGWSPAGALLISGLYDTRTMEKNQFFEAYFGSDRAVYEGASFLGALARTNVPLFVTTAEMDPPDFLRQGNELLAAYLDHHRRLPRYVQLIDHNHLSPALSLNSAIDTLSRPALEFLSDAGC